MDVREDARGISGRRDIYGDRNKSGKTRERDREAPVEKPETASVINRDLDRSNRINFGSQAGAPSSCIISTGSAVSAGLRTFMDPGSLISVPATHPRPL